MSRRAVRSGDGGKGEVVGWSGSSAFYDARPSYNATAEIGVYVSQDQPRKGIGGRLAQDAVRRVPELGSRTLTAGAFAHDEASVGLFEDFGFEVWARSPRVVELDGVEKTPVSMGLRPDGSRPWAQPA